MLIMTAEQVRAIRAKAHRSMAKGCNPSALNGARSIVHSNAKAESRLRRPSRKEIKGFRDE